MKVLHCSMNEDVTRGNYCTMNGSTTSRVENYALLNESRLHATKVLHSAMDNSVTRWKYCIVIYSIPYSCY